MPLIILATNSSSKSIELFYVFRVLTFSDAIWRSPGFKIDYTGCFAGRLDGLLLVTPRPHHPEDEVDVFFCFHFPHHRQELAEALLYDDLDLGLIGQVQLLLSFQDFVLCAAGAIGTNNFTQPRLPPVPQRGRCGGSNPWW